VLAVINSGPAALISRIKRIRSSAAPQIRPRFQELDTVIGGPKRYRARQTRQSTANDNNLW